MTKKPNRTYKENDGNKYEHIPNYAEQVIKKRTERHNSYREQQELMIKDR
ncbi:hypothetical protein [Paenibacillus sp.]|nr:hypothetical protein [Paenibacillus sp.]